MRRPWNIINPPVYSLATSGETGVNMNICTYVSPVSSLPRQYAVGVYKNTYTLVNLLRNGKAVLQLLNETHAPLVRPLGNKSGHSFDKSRYLSKKKALTEWRGHSVLAGANAWILLEKHRIVDAGGDHQLWVFNATAWQTNSEEGILTLGTLIDKRIVLS